MSSTKDGYVGSSKSAQMQHIIDENNTLKMQVLSLKEALEVTNGKAPASSGEELQKFDDSQRVDLGQKPDEKESLEAKIQELESTLQAIETQKKEEIEIIQEKYRLTTRKRAQAQSKLASVNEELKKLSKEKDQLKKEVNNNNDELNNLRRECATLSQSLKEKDGIIVSSLSELKAKSSKLEQMENETLQRNEEIKNLKSQLDARIKEIDQMKPKLNEALRKLDEQASSYKIASKKSTTLMKDLKSQLQKETEINSSIRESLRLVEEELASWKRMTAPPAIKSHTTFEPSTKTKGSTDDGIKLALASRLEGLLNENQALKEKVRFLEENVNAANSELVEMKKRAEANKANERIGPVLASPEGDEV